MHERHFLWWLALLSVGATIALTGIVLLDSHPSAAGLFVGFGGATAVIAVSFIFWDFVTEVPEMGVRVEFRPLVSTEREPTRQFLLHLLASEYDVIEARAAMSFRIVILNDLIRPITLHRVRIIWANNRGGKPHGVLREIRPIDFKIEGRGSTLLPASGKWPKFDLLIGPGQPSPELVFVCQDTWMFGPLKTRLPRRTGLFLEAELVGAPSYCELLKEWRGGRALLADISPQYWGA